MRRIRFSPAAESRSMAGSRSTRPRRWTPRSPADASKCCRSPCGSGTRTWSMPGTMVAVVCGCDAGNYCLAATWAGGDNGTLSTRLPIPAEENRLGVALQEQTENAHSIRSADRQRSPIISAQGILTFRTNSSACSAALWANAPKSISSDKTPAFSTSVIYGNNCVRNKKHHKSRMIRPDPCMWLWYHCTISGYQRCTYEVISAQLLPLFWHFIRHFCLVFFSRLRVCWIVDDCHFILFT